MPALVIIAGPSGGLNGYNDWDVVDVIPASADPGAAVRDNTPARFRFLYVSNASVEQLQALLQPMEDANMPAGEDGQRELLAKRITKVRVDSLPSDSETYRDYNDALAVIVTSSVMNTTLVEIKSRAEAVAQNLVGLKRRRDALQLRINTLEAE